MGIKDLWSILTPYSDRKPIFELRGKVVAIDLAGWVCESLNVVDYFVHPRHHLKNLFFRTCYLIWEDVTPVFVLEGTAPKLKSQVIEKRNEIQFRGVRPKETQSQLGSQKQKNDKGRTRFNYVLKQCESLLLAMGIECVQAPGEAEAYCAFLNSKRLVDGVISQDSDCFAYGALRVYRNFSVSSQGALAAQGGAVDIYDMNNICSKIDFGQNKVIAMALLCGCDYCPEGVGGVGRDSVLKLFNRYKDDEILKRIRSWRTEDHKYNALEMKVDDKTVCSNCGHIGRTQSHTKKGCGVCRTNHGCDESLWKEERLSLKAELTLRKKALAIPNFPSEEIVEEFLKQPKEIPKLELHWRRPDIVKFIRQIGHLLQWPEIYCFRKFFPILTRWQILNSHLLKDVSSAFSYITPKEIIKKRVVKGVPSLEIFWIDENGIFSGLIPENQIKELLEENPNGIKDIWSTVEPFDKVNIAYPSLVESFLKTKDKTKKVNKRSTKTKKVLPKEQLFGSLENFNELVEATNEVAKTCKPARQSKAKKCSSKRDIQMIDKFFKQKIEIAMEEYDKRDSIKCKHKSTVVPQKCSTPITKNIPSDLESDTDEEIFNMSDIVNNIVSNSQKAFALSSHMGKKLCYEEIKQDISNLLSETVANKKRETFDDFDIPNEKRSLSDSFFKNTYKETKRQSLDDSFDVLVKKGLHKSPKTKDFTTANISKIMFCEKKQIEDEGNVSYFFSNTFQLEIEDAFERIIDTSIAKQSSSNELNDFVLISD